MRRSYTFSEYRLKSSFNRAQHLTFLFQATSASSRKLTTTVLARSLSNSLVGKLHKRTYSSVLELSADNFAPSVSTRPVLSLPATTSESATSRSGLSSCSHRVSSVSSSSPPRRASWITRRHVESTLPARLLASFTRCFYSQCSSGENTKALGWDCLAA